MRVELHLGVHKTATTHLQRWWIQCSKVPGAADYAPMNKVRESFTPASHVGERTARAERSAGAARVWLEDWQARTDRLVMSDENLLGGCSPLFAGQSLYANAGERLALVAQLLAQCELHVWLCVREYSSFIRSAYCEVLRGQPYRPFRQLYTGFNLAERSWCELAADVRDAFPGASVNVWSYESLDLLRGSITSSLFGVPEHSLPEPDNQRDRQSLSRVAARLLDDIYKHAGEQAATDARASAERVLVGPNFQRFDPWSPEERADMVHRYEQDIERLRAMPGLRFLG